MPKTKTEKAFKRADVIELIACLNFAIKHLYAKGSGMVIRPGGEVVNFVTWFERALKPFGVEYDSDLLAYVRASQAGRKVMVKDPKFAKKLAIAKAA